MTRRLLMPAAALVATVAALAACGSGDGDSAASLDTGTDSSSDGSSDSADGATGTASDAGGAGDCAPDSLETLEPGVLTVGTGEPAYEPWVVDDDPTSGEGFESAVAYAVAQQLGYAEDDVTWVRTTFDGAIQPGPKTFDVNLQQFSITDERRQAVDFSSPYYEVRQAVVTIAGSPAADATSLADLTSVTFGAAVGTTSLQAITDTIRPDAEPQVFNSNDDAKLALSNGQVDALVVDLPTALYLAAAELEDGVVVGQLPQQGSGDEAFGLVLDKDSPLTECVSEAVDALADNGTLDALEAQWLTDAAGAPELS